MKKALFVLLSGFMIARSYSQAEIKRILFIGNSFVYTNDLPGVLSGIASSTGDSIFYDMNAPAGNTFQQHVQDTATLNRIAMGGWDYVIMQEHSQLPGLPMDSVMQNTYPYAKILDSLVNAQNPCAETVFYMTWGRENGDSLNCDWWPPICTYEGMDSLVLRTYLMLTDSMNAILSPCGVTWHYIRDYYPMLPLYNTDGAHPSPYGQYANALSFYSVIFRKDPTLVTYNSVILPEKAALIRIAAKAVVFDSLSKWSVGNYDLHAEFTNEMTGVNTFTFTNLSLNTDSCLWDFGDGTTSTEINPVHSYTELGNYPVVLNAFANCKTEIATDTVKADSVIVVEGIFDENEFSIIQISNDEIQIETGQHGDFYFIIYGLSGQRLSEGKLETTISIANLNPGIYYLQLLNNSVPVGTQAFLVGY